MRQDKRQKQKRHKQKPLKDIKQRQFINVCKKGDTKKVIQFLKEGNVDVVNGLSTNTWTIGQRSAIHYACINNHYNIAQRLIKYVKQKKLILPEDLLYYVVEKTTNKNIIKLLLLSGADISYRTRWSSVFKYRDTIWSKIDLQRCLLETNMSKIETFKDEIEWHEEVKEEYDYIFDCETLGLI